MKNRIINWGKRYFLFSAPTPFVAGFSFGVVPAVITACGWMVALLVTNALGRLDLLGPSTDPWLFGFVFGFLGFGVVMGILNEVVCRRFVSYRRKEPGAFFAYEVLTVKEINEGRPTRGKRLAAAFGKLWFRKRQEEVEIRWFGLPLTGSRREIKMNLGSFPGLLRVTFGGDFDLKEVYGKIVRWGDHEGFDDWLRSLVLEVSKTSGPVQQVLRQISRRAPESLLLELKAPLRIALKDAGFPKVLGNVEGIEFTLYYTCTSVMTFNMA